MGLLGDAGKSEQQNLDLVFSAQDIPDELAKEVSAVVSAFAESLGGPP